jgi:gamma-glutamyltranspeptidase / glutathione hydrolase
MAEKKRAVKMAVPAASLRPTMVGRNHAASAGHYLATLAAMRVLDRGGNAVDAGVTASMALSVLQPDMVSFACVAPTLIYMKELDKVISLAGLGYWPKNTDIAKLIAAGNGKAVPENLLRTVIPAAPATYIAALRRYGTISFEEAATPAMELAKNGFAVYPLLASNIEYLENSFRRWPDNERIFLPKGRAPKVGELFLQEDLAKTIARLIQAERDCKGDRDKKLAAVHDYFYRGPIAREIADYHAANGGFMTFEDLAAFEVPVENSIQVDYRGYTVHACDVWCQGIVLLESLKILEGYDLKSMQHNSPDYAHLIAAALNLSFADREAYVGDPKFMHVPRDAMISEAYAKRQRARINMQKAFGRLPDPGDPEMTGRIPGVMPEGAAAAPHGLSRLSQDTIYNCVVDRWGNAYSATTSDNASETPIIPGTGLAISSRGCQSRLEKGHPAEVKPGKRPRLTPNPAMAFKDGKLFMTFGTPGGDQQSQGMLQVFLNVVEHGMTMQQAVEAPRISSQSFPNSFAPHAYYPGRLNVEEDLGPEVIAELRRRGHDVEVWPRFPAANAAVCAIKVDPDTGLRHAGADPRREGYALAW